MLSKAKLQANLEDVERRIAEAAERSGRTPQCVRLVAVTKTVSVDEARILRELGHMDFGENRVGEARAKIEALGDSVRWHMVGPVQRRKARDVVALFHFVDSIDRVEVAEAIEKRCEERDKTLQVLVEANVSGEESKHGFSPEALPQAVDEISRMPHLVVDGLMTMAPLVSDPEEVRPVFARLRALGEELGLPELSMGMSNDFEVAVEEGATQVRIGSALFTE